MHYNWKIDCWDVENVYTHTWLAYLLFHNFHFHQCHLLAQVAFRTDVAFRAKVPSGLVEVRRFLCSSSVSADAFLCHCSMQRSHPDDFYKPLPCFFLLQPSPFHAQETQLLASSVRRLRRFVSGLVVAFPLLRRVKTLRWPFWPHSGQRACRTVLAVADLLASP